MTRPFIPKEYNIQNELIWKITPLASWKFTLVGPSRLELQSHKELDHSRVQRRKDLVCYINRTSLGIGS